MSVIRPPASTWFPMFGLFSGWLPARRRASRASSAAKPVSPRVDFDRIMAGVREVPQVAAAPVPRTGVAEERFEVSMLDARRRRVRDRYIGARFPGIAKCGADLADEEKVIRIARLMFEDGRGGDAIELLELAIEEFPERPAPWLARLEILYLIRDAAAFTRTARAYAGRHRADIDTWKEVCRLGQALAPGEKLFAGEVAARDYEHYGPWPHTPNWIRSSWDLTAEIAASDFHNCLRRARERSAAREAA